MSQKYLPDFLYFSLKVSSVAFFQRTSARFSCTRDGGERRQKCIKQFQTKPSSVTPIAFCVAERMIPHKQQPQNQPKRQLTIFASWGPLMTKLVHMTVHGKQQAKTHVDGLSKQVNHSSLKRDLSAKSFLFLERWSPFVFGAASCCGTSSVISANVLLHEEVIGKGRRGMRSNWGWGLEIRNIIDRRNYKMIMSCAKKGVQYEYKRSIKDKWI